MIRIFSISFILFSMVASMQEHEAAEHDKFSNEYHQVLRQSLNDSSPILAGMAYDIKDGKFNMIWKQQGSPELTFDFEVLINEKKVCHLSFQLIGFLKQVPELLKDKESETATKIVNEIQKCGEAALKEKVGDKQPIEEDALAEIEKNLDVSISNESIEEALQNKLDSYEKENDSIDWSSDESLQVPLKLERHDAVIIQKPKCDPQIKTVIKSHLKTLAFFNLILDVKIFDENITNCTYEQGQTAYLYDSVLAFNRERCYLRTKYENGQVKLITSPLSIFQFMIYKGNDIPNCAERLATLQLLTTH